MKQKQRKTGKRCTNCVQPECNENSITTTTCISCNKISTTTCISCNKISTTTCISCNKISTTTCISCNKNNVHSLPITIFSKYYSYTYAAVYRCKKNNG